MNKINEILKNSDYNLTIFNQEIQWVEDRIITVNGKKGVEYKGFALFVIWK